MAVLGRDENERVGFEVELRTRRKIIKRDTRTGGSSFAKVPNQRQKTMVVVSDSFHIGTAVSRWGIVMTCTAPEGPPTRLLGARHRAVAVADAGAGVGSSGVGPCG